MWRVILTTLCLAVSITLIGCAKPGTDKDKKGGGAAAGGVTIAASKDKTEIEPGKDETIELTITPKDKEVTLTVNDTKDKKVTASVTPEKTKDGKATLKISVEAAAKADEKVTVTVTGKEGTHDGKKDIEVTIKKK